MSWKEHFSFKVKNPFKGKVSARAYLFYGLCFIIVGISPFLGVGGFPDGWVFWRLRFPRMVAGLLAGAGLSLCGMCYQGMFRNVLATPYTLGVSSGAALGVALAVRLQVTGEGVLGVGVTSLWAFMGGLVSMGVVWGLSRMRPLRSPHVLLLSGVAASFFFSSLIMFLQYVGTPGETSQIMRWLMGGLDVYSYGDLGLLALFFALGSSVIFTHLKELNLLTVGEEFAASRGVSLGRTKLLLHLGVSILVGGIVALCGPIGFVGMVCPHVSRLLVGGNHLRLAPVTLVLGGVFLVACDTLGRIVLIPSEIPVGIITALLGGPFFLWMLLRK